MGTEMTAFIEYDKAEYYAGRPGAPAVAPPPFSEEWEMPHSLSMGEGIYTGSKDYTFFAAIAGVRNKTDIPPLYEPRGLPSNLSRVVKQHSLAWGVGDFCQGWLTTAEIHAALKHHAVNPNHLSFETHTILNIMNDLEARLGVGRVRLIFGFD